LDHVVVLGEAHLRQIVRAYADYYRAVHECRGISFERLLAENSNSRIERAATVDARLLFSTSK
jgi:hypothetical protein